MFDYIKDFLKANDVEFSENKKLSELSTVKIGGEARIIAYPKNQSLFTELISLSHEIGMKYYVLGRMSNVLPRDEGFEGLIIKTDKLSNYILDGNTITASSGVSLPFISRLAISAGIGGFEELSGIPGSVGGAVVGNAGAFGRECGELVLDALIYDVNERSRYTVNGSDLDFGYRSSSLKNSNCYVLSVRFHGFASDINRMEERAKFFLSKRRDTQPCNFPSLGSTFKRTDDGISAGYLIDKCGLKGYSVGGVKISDKHAGFIVNVGGASCDDYLTCADFAARKVLETFGQRLEKEIVLL